MEGSPGYIPGPLPQRGAGFAMAESRVTGKATPYYAARWVQVPPPAVKGVR